MTVSPLMSALQDLLAVTLFLNALDVDTLRTSENFPSGGSNLVTDLSGNVCLARVRYCIS